MIIINKIKLFKQFKRSLNPNLRNELSGKFNVRIDKAYRIYGVINVPETMIGDAYSLKKSDIDKISENYIKLYIKQLSDLLDNNGMREMYKRYDLKKIDKYSWLIVIGFSLFKSNVYYNILYYVALPILVVSSIITFILFT